MADEADAASDLEELARLSAIAQSRAQLSQRRIVPRGRCHACETPVTPQQLFCDSECAQDWEWVQQGRRRKMGLV